MKSKQMDEILLLNLVLMFSSLIHQSFFIFALSTSHPPASQPYISPVYTSMASFSSGVQLNRDGRHRLDAHKKLLIGLIVGCSSLGAIILCCLCIWSYRWRHSHKNGKNNVKSSDGESGIALPPFLRRFSSVRSSATARMSIKKGFVQFFDYKTLEKGTNNFKESNVLGQGGFGCVYKARFDNNTLVAVKKMECIGQEAKKEFQNEVDLLSKMRHSNVISLLGYSIEASSSFIVYELMQNGSLETQLHGPSRGSALTWQMRMKIALDTARGLEYLHEHCNPPVIHRDVKSSNILLDTSFNAKLSDFGLAITYGLHNKNNIKLSGTLGYVAPEYMLNGKLTDKSDVYAYGVVLLELLLGRRPVEKLAPAQCQSLVTWAMPQLTDRSKLPNIVDPVIKDTTDLKHLCQVAAVAVLCVQPEPSYRPLVTDVLHSLIPLVPVELGGTLRMTHSSSAICIFDSETET